MTHLTRLDFAIGSAGLMRRALSQAIHHASGRRAFRSPSVPAADAERARGPDARGRGVDPARPSGWRAPSTTRRRAMRVPACWCASARRSANTGTASGRSVSCTRRSNAMAATASSRRARWRGSIARPRSMASGKAAATSSRSTSCGRPANRQRACRRFSTRCGRRRGATSASIGHRAPRGRASPTRAATRRGRAGSCKMMASPCRRACSSATRPPRWPTPSAPRVSRALGHVYGSLTRRLEPKRHRRARDR